MSAKHSDVHLFWGDLPERIAPSNAEIRQHARAHGRENEIGFGMRLQVICREDEADAWEAADQLVRHATERQKQEMKTLYHKSEANLRLQQFIDAGCHSFCLSGYLHDEEAERFGRLIRPILAENNRGRWAA